MSLNRETTPDWLGRSWSERSFRNNCGYPFPSHLFKSQRSRKNARTCIEGPFGEVLRATGPMAKANAFRFSTKYQDDETDLLYYGYRYYTPSIGRWLSRDSIGERGAFNLYGFVQNNPLGYYDYLGREGYWNDVGTTFQGMGQGALTVGKEVGYFAGDLLLGFVVVVT